MPLLSGMGTVRLPVFGIVVAVQHRSAVRDVHTGGAGLGGNRAELAVGLASDARRPGPG